MFGDVAETLLKMMGQSGVLPGALLAKDVPTALERLKRGAAMHRGPDPADAESGDAEGKVSLKQRAFPLVELLSRCAQKNCDIVWEQDRPMFPGKAPR